VLCRKVVHGYNTNAVEDKDKKKSVLMTSSDMTLLLNVMKMGLLILSFKMETFFLHVCTVIPFINEPSYIKVSGKHIYVFMTYSISCCLCDMYGSIECVCMYVDM